MRPGRLVWSVAFLVATVAFLPRHASAQTFTAGVKGGVNIANVHFTDVPSGLTFTPKHRVGGTGGVFFGADFNQKGGFLVEVLYSQRGAKVDLNSEGISFTDEVQVDYIDVPVVGRVSLKASDAATVHLFAGPLFAFKVKNSESVTLNGVAIPNDEPFGPKTYDTGVTFGGTIDIHQALVDARYTLGLVNIDNSSGADEPKVKTRTFSVMVGFRIK